MVSDQNRGEINPIERANKEVDFVKMDTPGLNWERDRRREQEVKEMAEGGKC